jgi:hypothetical protein
MDAIIKGIQGAKDLVNSLRLPEMPGEHVYRENPQSAPGATVLPEENYEGGMTHAAMAAPASAPSANTTTAVISLAVWLSTGSSSSALGGRLTMARHDSAVTSGATSGCAATPHHLGRAAESRSAISARTRHDKFRDFAGPQQRQPDLQVGGIAYRRPAEFRHQIARLEPGTLRRRSRVDSADYRSGEVARPG